MAPVVAGIAVMLLAPDARACSCTSLPESVPRDGDVVSPDALVWLSANHVFTEPDSVLTALEVQSAVSWQGPAGLVEFDSTPLLARTPLAQPGPVYYSLTPRSTLPAGRHELTAPNGGIAFEVDPALDTALPSVSEVQLASTTSYAAAPDDTCGSSRYALFEVEYEGDVLVMDVNGESTLEGRTWTVSGAPEEWPIVGSSFCHRTWDFELGAAQVRFGAFSVNGQFSGWSDPIAVWVPPPGDDDEESGSGCAVSAVAPRGAGGMFGLAAVAGIAVRLRRRR